MKAASGDTDNGGDIKLWLMVEGLSLEMLCVRERTCRTGEMTPDSRRNEDESAMGLAMVVVVPVNYVEIMRLESGAASLKRNR